MKARFYGRVFGALLVLLGVAGFFSGGFPLFGVLNVDPFENLLHLSTGVVLLGAGFVPRGGRAAGVAALTMGVLYTLVGAVGIILPNLFGLVPVGLSLVDDLLHLAIGALGLFLFKFETQAAGGEGSELALSEAQTMAVTTVILFQIFYLLNCRSLRDSFLKIGLWSNPWVYVGIGALVLLQLGFIYLPFMNVLFGTAPLLPSALLQSLLVALIVLPVISAEKWVRSRRRDEIADGCAGRVPAKTKNLTHRRS